MYAHTIYQRQTMKLELDPLSKSKRTSSGAVFYDTQKWLSGCPLDEHASISGFQPFSICLFSPPSSTTNSISPAPPHLSHHSPPTLTFLIPSVPLPPFHPLFSSLCLSFSDPRRQANDIQHQKKWCWHVCVCWNKHGWRERQWSCWTRGVWWVIITASH